jgi:hypothetical protein
MAARAATFVVKRGDVARLAEAASDASRSRFTQTLAECMIEPGEGFGFKGYILVFLFSYLQNRRIWLGSEYPAAEQAMTSVAAVGGYFLTSTAFSSIDDLDPEHHRGSDIDRAVAQLGVEVADAATDGLTWLGILHEKVGVLSDDQVLLVLVG